MVLKLRFPPTAKGVAGLGVIELMEEGALVRTGKACEPADVLVAYLILEAEELLERTLCGPIGAISAVPIYSHIQKVVNRAETG